MSVQLKESNFDFTYKGKNYRVNFCHSNRHWYVYVGNSNDVANDYNWNGIKQLPNGQDAEDIINEFLGIED